MKNECGTVQRLTRQKVNPDADGGVLPTADPSIRRKIAANHSLTVHVFKGAPRKHARSIVYNPSLLPSCHHFVPRSGGSASVGAGQPPSRPPPVERSASLGEEFHSRGLPGPDCHHQRRFSARHRRRGRERQESTRCNTATRRKGNHKGTVSNPVE